MSVRFAIIGCGMIGSVYAERLRRQGHAVVAACDARRDRAEALAPGGAYADHRDLFAAGGFDVACICTPTPLHHAAVLDAAASGVDVFLEKPMAVTLAEAIEMREAMRRAGRRIGFGFKMRFETVFAAAEQRIRAGRIGAPRFATFSFYQPVPPGERIWYADIGVIRDMLVHMFDMATWMFNATPIAVRARTRREIGRAGEDKAFIDLLFDGGREARVQGGYLPDYPDVAGREDIVFQVVGERGFLAGKRPDVLISVTAAGREDVPVAPADPFGAELAAFIRRRDGRPLPVSGEDGLAAQRIIELADRSAALDGAPGGVVGGWTEARHENPDAQHGLPGARPGRGAGARR